MPDRRARDERDDREAREDAPQPGAPDEAALAIVARHALHDEELVAAFAAGALDAEDEAEERARAGSLVDRCQACRAVHDDIAAITIAVKADASLATRAPRDFRLTVEDARRLGGTVVVRSPIGAFRRFVLGVARPLGASVAALGLVGVLVGSAVMGAAGLPSGPAEDVGATVGGALSSSAAPSTFEVAINPGFTPKASERIVAGPVEPARDAASAPTAWLLIVSVLAVAGGIGLFLYGARAASKGGTAPGSH